ncbi:MAG: methylamine utilization protein [Proteobacteria bacterium]|nr:methylamine utilization protein [Pseudomonadota bacterium]
MTRLAATACLMLAAGGACAAPLTVAISTADGAPYADVVAILDPAEGPAPTPAEPGSAVIDQVHKAFVPRVSVIRTGTAVYFPNSDRIRHQVYSLSAARSFNLKLYAGTAAPPVVFGQSGLVVLGCNIHDSMVGFVAVVDTPYFGRTGADGRARIEAPAGRYRLRLWHPELAATVAPRAVVLGAEPQTLELRVARGDDPSAVSPWVD